MTASDDSIWVIVPAGGSGSRMQSSIPKQYLRLGGRCVLQWSIDKFSAIVAPGNLVVVVDDFYRFETSMTAPQKLTTVKGGASRAESVRAGLAFVLQRQTNPWVLVHDAARPCVQPDAIRKLIDRVMHSGKGGILAVPVTDTVKTVNTGFTTATLEREQIWLAHTPQMYRAADLAEALDHCSMQGIAITDEASAMEYCGIQSVVVEDSANNIKITVKEDLALAEFFLRNS